MKPKRIILLILSALIAATMFSGCSGSKLYLGQASVVTASTTFTEASVEIDTPESSSADESSESSEEDEEGEDESTPESSSSESKAEFEGGSVTFNVVTAAVTLTKSGVIKSLKLDKYEVEVAVDKNGNLLSGISTEGIKSAKELGYDYGMKSSSKISLEWFEQVEKLEKWAEGKTVDEFLAMKTAYVDSERPSIPNEPDLTVSVSISVGEFLAATRAAAINAGWTGEDTISESESSVDSSISADSFFESGSESSAVTDSSSFSS